MATYNGEAYVADQIRSIQSQTYADWRLLVHDDGSNDSTCSILRSFAKQDERVVLIEDGQTGFGVAHHFIHMLFYATAPFCMFCDQDDVWLPTKVEHMLTAIQPLDQDQPQVVYSNAYLWNSEEGVIADKNTLTFPTTLRQALFLNSGIQGAAAIFNQPMRTLLAQPLTYYAMHDHALLLTAICFGQVHYLHEPLMYYRQHSNNLTGNAPGSLRKKIRLMWRHRQVPLVCRKHYDGLQSFYTHFQSKLSVQDSKLIAAFLAMPNQCFFKRVMTILQYKFQLFDSTLLLLIKLCLRRYI